MNEEELIRLIRKSMDDHEQDYGPDVWSSWTYHDKVNGVVDQAYTRDQIEKVWYQIIIAESDGVVDAVGDTHLKDINLNKSNGLTQINKQYTDEGEPSEASSAVQIWADNEGANTLQVPFHAERLRGDPSYNLKAGKTSGISGGTITPSAYSINTISGFGIYAYSGTGSNGTIAHGLGSAPKMIICKRTAGDTGDWNSWHSGLTSGAYYINFNTASAEVSNATVWNSTVPSSTEVSLGTYGAVNASGSDYVM